MERIEIYKNFEALREKYNDDFVDYFINYFVHEFDEDLVIDFLNAAENDLDILEKVTKACSSSA